METLQDKGVVVTGAGGGIGAALARRFAAAGARVVVNDLDAAKARRPSPTRSAASPCRATPPRSCRRPARRSAAPSTCTAPTRASARGGPEAAPEEVWASGLGRQRHGPRTRGRTRCCPTGWSAASGRFVSTVSAAGLLTMIGAAPYSVTKHGAYAFAEWLSLTYRHRGIDVHAICPQGVRTDMLAATGTAGDLVLTPTAIEPEDVADALFAGMAEDRFLILPHPEVAEYYAAAPPTPTHWLDRHEPPPAEVGGDAER